MSLAKILFLIANAPRLYRLFKEIWLILSYSKDEELEGYIENLDRVIIDLKEARTREEKIKTARDIVKSLSKLHKRKRSP